MIKKRACILLLIALIIPFSLAISTDMKENYMSGETMIIKISGNILESITSEQIKFVDYSIGYKELALDYDIRKIGESHYIYAVMPYLQDLPENESMQYTLLIEDVATTVNGQRSEVDFMQNFSVSDEIIPYSITPGVIVSSDDFEVQVNLNLDENVEISIDFPASRSIVLRPGKNTIDFSLDEVSGGIYIVSIGDYSLPVLINKEIAKYLPPVRFTRNFIESRVLTGQTEYYEIEFVNYGSVDVSGAYFEYDNDRIGIYPEMPEVIKAGESYLFNVSLLEENSDLNQDILIIYGNDSSILTLSVVYTSDAGEVGTNYTSTDSVLNEALCSELGGSKCSSIQICSGDIVNSKDQSQCCIGICVENIPVRPYAWVGYLIGGLLLVVLLVVGYRYFRSRKEKDNFSQKVKTAEKKLIP